MKTYVLTGVYKREHECYTKKYFERIIRSDLSVARDRKQLEERIG